MKCIYFIYDARAEGKFSIPGGDAASTSRTNEQRPVTSYIATVTLYLNFTNQPQYSSVREKVLLGPGRKAKELEPLDIAIEIV